MTVTSIPVIVSVKTKKNSISFQMNDFQPGSSMMSLVCSDPPKMVCSDPPNMVCSDPFYILEGSLQTKDAIDGPGCMYGSNPVCQR